MSKNRKILSIILTTVLFFNTSFTVLAIEAPTAPSTPENDEVAPTAPTPPVSDRERPKPPSEPDAPPPRYTDSTNNMKDSGSGDVEEPSSGDKEDTFQPEENSEGIDANMNNGDTTISTEDADSSTNISNTGNTNVSAGGSQSDSGSGQVNVSNSDNGAFSDNNSSATIVKDSDTVQENNANLENQLDQSTLTGDNSASFNNGDSYITTGDSNTSANLVNSVNTNVDSVAIAEFNIADDHVGDIVLDYNTNCVQGCTGGDISLENSGNGTGSENESEANITNNKNTDQLNDAALINDVALSANSGDNKTDFNTGGDSNIQTGDANISANVNNFVNNNIAGNVVLGIVNIYGDLVGDIILTQEAMNAFCGDCLAEGSVSNEGNGAYSTNNANLNQTNNSNTSQFNNADIQNNLIVYANTGDNETSLNTGGNSTILTGDANVDVNVVNVANTNLSDGNWWLVIVNEAGQWVGKLFGSDNQGNLASSEGLQFTTDENGEVVVSNTANGAGSKNTSTVNAENNTSVEQTNDAKIVNNVNLSANTGGNSASYNTGGDSAIQTGDANVVASIVNFVNNNIAGSGKLFVNVVNVFGSWLGDFMTPGHTKEEDGQNSSLASAANENSNSDIGRGGQNDTQDSASNSAESSSQSDTENTTTADEEKPTPTFSNYSGSLLASTSVAGLSDEYEKDEIEESGQTGDKLAYDKDSFYEFTEDGVAGEKILNINLAWIVLGLIAFWALRKTDLLQKLLFYKKRAK